MTDERLKSSINPRGSHPLPDGPPAPALDERARPRSRRASTAKRVLVVDDSPGVTLALKVAFRMDGRFEIGASAGTAAEGLQKFGEQDAVLLDLHLPDLEGPALVGAFSAHDVPVILHSAADDTPEVDAVRDMVDAVILKSRVDDLLVALTRLTHA